MKKFLHIQRSSLFLLICLFFSSYSYNDIELLKSEPYVINVKIGDCLDKRKIPCYDNFSTANSDKFVLCYIEIDSVLFQKDRSVYKDKSDLVEVVMGIVAVEVYEVVKNKQMYFSATNSNSREALILLDIFDSNIINSKSQFKSKDDLYFSGLLNCVKRNGKVIKPFDIYLKEASNRTTSK